MIIIIITTFTFQGIPGKLKATELYGFARTQKPHLKMGSNWGLTAVPLSLPPKSGNFWKSGWRSRLDGSKLRVVNNPKPCYLIKQINKALKVLQKQLL